VNDHMAGLRCPHCSERAVTLAPTGEFVCFACHGSGHADTSNGIVTYLRKIDQHGRT